MQTLPRPSVGSLRPDISLQNLYTVRVQLPRRVDDLDEVIATVTHVLTPFHLVTQHDRLGRTTLVLALGSRDLWQAILLTMNAVTSTGYAPLALTAEPAEEFEITNSPAHEPAAEKCW